MRVRVGVMGIVIALALVGCGQAAGIGGGDGPASPVTSSSASPGVSSARSSASDVGLGAGWRWESYGNVELQVPETWGYGTTGSPWCLSTRTDDPYVGRPGPVADIGCVSNGTGGAPDPGLTVKRGGTFVWFQYDTSDTRPTPSANQGDRLTLIAGEVEVAIQAPAKVREQIASSVRVITGPDAHGCPITHPISTNPAWRPLERSTANQLVDATAVSACRYTLWDTAEQGSRRARPSSSLISSLELTGADAAAADRGITVTPGSGPDDPGSCLDAYGDEAVVLLIQHGDSPGTQREIVLRYSGCDHHGFDDGRNVTVLTRSALTPFLTGPNQVNVWSGVLNGVMPNLAFRR